MIYSNKSRDRFVPPEANLHIQHAKAVLAIVLATYDINSAELDFQSSK